MGVRTNRKPVGMLLIIALLLSLIAALQPSRAHAEEEAQAVEPTDRQPDIYISDLQWDSAKSGWAETRINQSLDGNPLTVAGTVYAKGLGSHADSEIAYTLAPAYKRFVAAVGLDDEVMRDPNYVKAKAKFVVKIDGNEAAVSPELALGETYAFDIAIPDGAQKITLIGDGLGDITCDHTNWLNAGFVLDNPGGGTQPSEPADFASPDGKVTGTVEAKDGKLVYSVQYNGLPVIETSPLGIMVDGVDAGLTAVLGQAETTAPEAVTYPWKGNHSTATDHHTLTTIPVTNALSGLAYSLEVKSYDNGITFRYVIPEGMGERAISGESTSFTLPEDSQVWYQSDITAYEGRYSTSAVQAVAAGTRIGPPLTIKLPDGNGYAAITEGALLDYPGMSLLASGSRSFKASFNNGGAWSLPGEVKTPWRIVSIAADLNGLLNSDIVPNTAPAQSPIFNENGTDWIKPGASTWSWLGGGGVTVETMKRYIDLASELGIPYNLIDEGWTDWGTGSQTYWEALKEVIDYGKSKNVQSWVWKAVPDRSNVPGIYDKAARNAFFAKMKEVGAVGVKLDFIDGEQLYKMNFYRDALEEAASYGLMVNFHGANKPTGLSRTYPNEITREGIHGLEQGAPPASHNTTLPFTRYLAGHADYTPVSFTSKLGASSWSHQLASAITFTSPSISYGEHPENLLMNPAVELIKSIPAVWDETIVLPGSEIGEVSAFARRSGTTWFIAVMNGTEPRDMSIDLSFLGEGSYNAAIYADDMTSQEGYSRMNEVVNSGNQLHIQLRGSGGYTAKLSKLDMEPYGGGFLSKRKVYLKAVDPDSDIRYTLDGSEPTAASPKYEGFIEISESAAVRAKVIAGEDAGSEIKAQFNKTTPYLQIQYDGRRDWVQPGGQVRFRTNAEGSDYEIRYTLDGSQPDRSSLLYSGPFSLPVSTAAINAKLYVAGYPDSNPVQKTLYTFDHRAPVPPLPEIYLDSLNWVSATSGWTEPKKNKSVDGNPLTAAGKTYERGIGTHANSDIVYDIPEGAVRFVAIAGADDEVDEDGGYASMIFRIYADDRLLEASPLIGKGDYWHFDVALPEGAKQLRLSLHDNGGKNYDHGDWLNAGFLSEETNPPASYSFTLAPEADGLTRRAGLLATVGVSPAEGTGPHDGKEVVVFELMKGDVPVSIAAVQADITAAQTFSALFPVADFGDSAYTVKVFVLDGFSGDLTAPVSLAEPIVLD